MVLTNSLLIQARTDVKDDLELVFLIGRAGTASDTPVASNTALGGQEFSKAVDSFDKVSQSDKITASLKILTTDANGHTLRELGWGLTAGSPLFTHDVVNALAKTSDINVYFDTTITIEVVEN